MGVPFIHLPSLLLAVGSVVHSGAPKMAYGKQNGERQGRQDRAAQRVKSQTQKGNIPTFHEGKTGQQLGSEKPALRRAEQSPEASFSQLILTELLLCGRQFIATE